MEMPVPVRDICVPEMVSLLLELLLFCSWVGVGEERQALIHLCTVKQ